MKRAFKDFATASSNHTLTYSKEAALMSIEATIKAIVAQAIKESQDSAIKITKRFEKYTVLDEIEGAAMFVVIAPATSFTPKPFYIVQHSYYGEFTGIIGRRNTPGKPNKVFNVQGMKEFHQAIGDTRV
jgi:hypothetical protein